MATSVEITQTSLILRNVPGVTPYPPDWEQREGGVEWFARQGAVLCRDADVSRVSRALARVLDRNPEEPRTAVGRDGRDQRPFPTQPTGSGATRLSWETHGDDDPLDVVEVLRRLARDPETAGVEVRPDHLMYVCAHSCAAIEALEVPPGTAPVPRLRTDDDALDPRRGTGAGVNVRLYDTGVVAGLTDAAWVAARPWLNGVTGDPENSFVPGKEPLLVQDAGHGTFAAGTLRTVAPEAQVHVVNALLPSADGSEMIGAAFESDLAALIRRDLLGPKGKYRSRPVPDVLAVNFAGRTLDDVPPLALATLWENLLSHLGEVLVIAPAGNDGDERKNWPAAFDWAVSVGALEASRTKRADWSCHGRTVDVYAPGDLLVNAFATGEYDTQWVTPPEHRTYDGLARWSGTSFAMPLVAGLVAARVSATGQSSRRAWHDLQAKADAASLPGTGPVLFPGD